MAQTHMMVRDSTRALVLWIERNTRFVKNLLLYTFFLEGLDGLISQPAPHSYSMFAGRIYFSGVSLLHQSCELGHNEKYSACVGGPQRALLAVAV